MWHQASSVSLMTRLRSGELGKRFCSRKFPGWLRGQPRLFSVCTGGSFTRREVAGPCSWLFTLRILPSLRMSGIIPISPYAFVPWRGGNFTLYTSDFFCVKVVSVRHSARYWPLSTLHCCYSLFIVRNRHLSVAGSRLVEVTFSTLILYPVVTQWDSALVSHRSVKLCVNRVVVTQN